MLGKLWALHTHLPPNGEKGQQCFPLSSNLGREVLVEPLGMIDRYLLKCRAHHGLKYDSTMRDLKGKSLPDNWAKKDCYIGGCLHSLGCWWDKILASSPKSKCEAWRRMSCFEMVLDSVKGSAQKYRKTSAAWRWRTSSCPGAAGTVTGQRKLTQSLALRQSVNSPQIRSIRICQSSCCQCLITMVEQGQASNTFPAFTFTFPPIFNPVGYEAALWMRVKALEVLVGFWMSDGHLKDEAMSRSLGLLILHPSLLQRGEGLEMELIVDHSYMKKLL